MRPGNRRTGEPGTGAIVGHEDAPAPATQLPGRRRALAAFGAVAASLAAPRLAAQDRPSLDGVAAEAEGLDQLHALIVSRAGTPLLARAFRGPPLSSPVNVKSVSKTIVATLAGIAIDRGHLSGPDALVLPLLDRPADGPRGEITMGHLLSMRSGLASTSGSDYGAWVSSGDWVDYALSRPLVSEPGTRFDYSTGNTHIAGAVLTAVTGRSLLSLARDWLGDPLDLTIPPWIADPQGRYLGGNEMAMSPEGLARFAAMILNDGMAGGTRVVSQSWIRTSWRPRARSPWSGDGYGYGWFVTRMAGRRAAYGRGYGGQLVAVVPSLSLSVVATSDPTRPARSGGYFGDLIGLAERAVDAAALA